MALHPYLGVDIDDTWDNLKYWNYVLEESAQKLPLGIFEAYPPQNQRIVNMTLQVESDSVVSVVFHGAIWIARDKENVSFAWVGPC